MQKLFRNVYFSFFNFFKIHLVLFIFGHAFEILFYF